MNTQAEADFLALSITMQEFPSFGFYNSGPLAGASQRHRHLQVVPTPLDIRSGVQVPVQQWFVPKLLGGRQPALPFRHQFRWIEDQAVQPASEREAGGVGRRASELYKHYMDCMESLQLFGGDSGRCLPYNLLVTDEWIMVVARSQERIHGVELNALGYAGAKKWHYVPSHPL